LDGDRNRDGKDEKSRPSKRTFCNAFTGCQGKRSDVAPMKDYDYGLESLKEASLDDNSVDDVARYFLAMARLMEAIQARNSMMTPLMRRQGFFGREKRATHPTDDSLDIPASRGGKGQRSE
jgi:hypothetical protein